MRIDDWVEGLNPVTMRELRTCSQSTRFHLVMVLVPLFIIAILIASLSLAEIMSDLTGFQVMSSGQLGSYIAGGTWELVGLMVLIVVPAYSFNAITGERTSRTLDQLIISPLGTDEIVRGKVILGLTIGLYLLVAVLPVLSTAYLLGGVDTLSLFNEGVMIIVYAYYYATLGVAVSSLARRTWTAAAWTFLSIGMLSLVLSIPQNLLGFSQAAGATSLPLPFLQNIWVVLGGAVCIMLAAALLSGKTRTVETAIMVVLAVAVMLTLRYPSILYRTVPARTLPLPVVLVFWLPSMFYLFLIVHGLLNQWRSLLVLTVVLVGLTRDASTTITHLLPPVLYLGVSELMFALATAQLVPRQLVYEEG